MNNEHRTIEHSPRQYSHIQELINNLPYIAMIVLGTAVLFLSISAPLWRWGAAAVYLIYGVTGALWIILFLCPFCRYYDTRACPCGYGQIAARLCRKSKIENLKSQILEDCFDKKFKKHIPVIVPLWFIPVVVGVIALIGAFSIGLLSLLIVFAVDAFLLLPLLSTKHSCKECPQRDICPWMRSKGKSYKKGERYAYSPRFRTR